ncbi:MAG: hypothetical protein ACFFDB_20410 [Promethearchaeota archaeon]
MNMRIFSQLVNRWREYGKSRKIVMIMKLMIIISGLVFSVFSFLTYISLETMLHNINIPSDMPEFNLDFSHYSKIKNTSIRIPYHISNRGFVDINHIQLRFKIDIGFTENITYQETQVTIYSKEYFLGDCRLGQCAGGVFTADYHDLNMTALGLYMTTVDKYQDEWRVLSISFSAYLADIIPFQFILKNMSIDNGDCIACDWHE